MDINKYLLFLFLLALLALGFPRLGDPFPFFELFGPVLPFLLAPFLLAPALGPAFLLFDFLLDRGLRLIWVVSLVAWRGAYRFIIDMNFIENFIANVNDT